LRGLPGIGKTTVAALLRNRLAPAVRVSVDTIRYLAQPRDLGDGTVHAGEAASAALARSYAMAGYTAIVDGVFADVETLDALRGGLENEGVEVQVVTLTLGLDQALARNAARDAAMQLPADRIVWLYERFDDSIGHVVFTGEHVAEEVAEIVEHRVGDSRADSRVALAPKTILFLRHGAPDVEPDRYPDHDAVGLSDSGRRQILGVRAAVTRLAPQAIVSSPLPRARETAELIDEALKVGVELDPRLRERTFQALHGQSYQAIAARLGEDAAALLQSNSDDVALPGESLDAAADRVVAAVADVAGRPEERILVVSHGGPHGWICAAALQAPGPSLGRRVALGLGRMSVFTIDGDGSPWVVALNSAPSSLLHLL
jgi:probable phosphoglycerate mutase